jgi:glutathione S-transferase
MKLYVSAASPFARKCRIVVRERGLLRSVREVQADPVGDDPDLLAVNPIAQVPALELDDGTTFFDSPVIAAYLDAFPGKPKLLPPLGHQSHWRIRRTETLADAILEMAVKITLENRRPEGERSQTWIERWRRNMARALDVAEGEVKPPPLDMGTLSLGVIGSYLDLRHPDFDWRGGRPRLTAFTAEVERMDSFQATRPA